MPFQSAPHEIEGETDLLGRPMVELELLVQGSRHWVRTHIDTACDDELLFEDINHAQSLGLQFTPNRQATRLTRYLADGSPRDFLTTRATLVFFGYHRPVTITTPEPLPPQVAGAPLPSRHASPRVLLGIPLLVGCTVALNLTNSPGNVYIRPSQALLARLAAMSSP